MGTSGQAVPGGSNGTPFFVATGNLDVPYYNVLGSELLWVDGPVSLQSEAMVNLVSQSGSTAVLPGVYAQAGYFLTGEHRPYDRKSGTIDRVIPKSNLGHDGKTCRSGCGAWEVAGRWSYLDLNDSDIRGGTIVDYTAGVNWYWNPYTKMASITSMPFLILMCRPWPERICLVFVHKLISERPVPGGGDTLSSADLAINFIVRRVMPEIPPGYADIVTVRTFRCDLFGVSMIRQTTLDL